MERPWWGESSWRGWKGGALLGAPACDGNPWNLLLLQVTATLETIWRKVSPALLLLLLLKGEMETVTMDNSKKTVNDCYYRTSKALQTIRWCFLNIVMCAEEDLTIDQQEHFPDCQSVTATETAGKLLKLLMISPVLQLCLKPHPDFLPLVPPFVSGDSKIWKLVSKDNFFSRLFNHLSVDHLVIATRPS